MAILAWIVAYWWIAAIGYGVFFVLFAAVAFVNVANSYRDDDADADADRADARADAEFYADADARADAEFYADDYGDPECRDHLARFSGGPVGNGAILRPCGCPFIGPPFDDCPTFLADAKALE